MIYRVGFRGDQPDGASSKPSKEKPGATVQPVKVHAPRLSAACHARAGIVTCGDLSGVNIGTKPEDFLFRAVDDFKLEWCASVKMPDLHGIDTMPM